MTPFDLFFLILVIGLSSVFLDRRWQARRSRQPQVGEDTPAPPKRPGWRQRRAIKKAEKEAAIQTAEEAARQFVAADAQIEATPTEGLSWRERRALKQEGKEAARIVAQERAAILNRMDRRERRAFKKAEKEAIRKAKEERDAARRAAAKRDIVLNRMSWRERRAYKKAEREAAKKAAAQLRQDAETASGLEGATDDTNGGEPSTGQAESESRQAQAAAQTAPREKLTPFAVVIAALIGLVLATGIWLAWSIGATFAQMGSEQSAGVNALLNVESTLTNNSVSLYKEYRVFTEFVRHQTLADLQTESGEESTSSSLAAVQLPFFLTRYLTREGDYDRERQLGEAWAEAEQRLSLDPAPHFSAVDAWQRRTELMIALFAPLVLALLTLTLAEALSQRRRILGYAAAFVGALLLILTVFAKLWTEIG